MCPHWPRKSDLAPPPGLGWPPWTPREGGTPSPDPSPVGERDLRSVTREVRSVVSPQVMQA